MNCGCYSSTCLNWSPCVSASTATTARTACTIQDGVCPCSASVCCRAIVRGGSHAFCALAAVESPSMRVLRDQEAFPIDCVAGSFQHHINHATVLVCAERIAAIINA